MSTRKKAEVVTFKVDGPLLEAMGGISNRSEFIRSAILSALKNTCPLCNGSGTLNPEQLEHWKAFAKHHSVKECGNCHSFHLVCNNTNNEAIH